MLFRSRHVYLSKTGEQRFGLSAEEWYGKVDAEFWPLELAEKFRSNDLAVLAVGEPAEVTEEMLNPDGSRCALLITKFPFTDAAGNRYLGGSGWTLPNGNRPRRRSRRSSSNWRPKTSTCGKKSGTDWNRES